MRVGVRERTETVLIRMSLKQVKLTIVLLTSGIPKGELDLLAIDLDIGNVVLKDSRDVDLCIVAVSVQGYLAQAAYFHVDS